MVAVSRREGWVDVLTGDGLLRLQTVRLDDGAPAPASGTCASVRATLGLRTADLLRELSALRQQLQGRSTAPGAS